MKINISRTSLLERLTLSSKFISNKLTSVNALQGVLIIGNKKEIHIHSTNLSSYYHGFFPAEGGDFKVLIEPRRVIEFLNLLAEDEITLEVKDNAVIIQQKKTKGSFPVIKNDDFPLPPAITEKGQSIESDFFAKFLPFVLFSAAKDETRPVLSAINMLNLDGRLCMVATDGFRLSFVKTKTNLNIPGILISADFLNNMLDSVKEEKKISFTYSEKEKIVLFTAGNNEFYSRPIEGEFPPFEKVIPTEKRSTAVIDREETVRNLKLVSVFAREHANIIVCEFKKEELLMRPKAEENKEDYSTEEIALQGEEQKVAFNSRFLIDYLLHTNTKKIIVEIVRSEAPIVFKQEKEEDLLHIIMPVRIQE